MIAFCLRVLSELITPILASDVQMQSLEDILTKPLCFDVELNTLLSHQTRRLCSFMTVSSGGVSSHRGPGIASLSRGLPVRGECVHLLLTSIKMTVSPQDEPEGRY